MHDVICQPLVIFAKITELVDQVDGEDTDGKVAKGIEYYYNSETFDKEEAPDALIFDEEDTTINKSGYIYSDTALEVDQIVEVFKYTDYDLKEDQANNMEWLVRTGGGGGAERPVIISSGETFEFGAIITSPTDLTPIREFTAEEGITFKSIMPWGSSDDVPDDFIFVGDLKLTTYYTESYPKTLYAKVNGAYPESGGIVLFDIVDSQSPTANLLLDNPAGRELILSGFDSAGSSNTARGYFNGKLFVCSYDHTDGNFYFNHPIF